MSESKRRRRSGVNPFLLCAAAMYAGLIAVPRVPDQHRRLAELVTFGFMLLGAALGARAMILAARHRTDQEGQAPQ